MRSGFPAWPNTRTHFATTWGAVELSMTSRWSNGPLEGQINRLKVIKCQMYGRAGFQLLKARVLPFEPLPACWASTRSAEEPLNPRQLLNLNALSV